MKIRTYTKTHWLLWPFLFVFRLVGFIIAAVGKLVGAVIGFALTVVGFALTVTLIGAGVGVPLMIFGILMMLVSIF